MSDIVKAEEEARDAARLERLAERQKVELRSVATRALRQVIADLDAQRAALAEEGDYVTLAEGAQDIATVERDLSAVLRQTRLDIARIVDANAGSDTRINRVEVEGVGAVEVKGGWKRTGWESERLLRALVQRAIDRVGSEKIVTADGEVVDVEESETLASILDALLTCLPITASTAWRTGTWPTEAKPEGAGLKRWGFDDADFCEREDQPRMAVIPRRD